MFTVQCRDHTKRGTPPPPQRKEKKKNFNGVFRAGLPIPSCFFEKKNNQKKPPKNTPQEETSATQISFSDI